MIYQSVVTDRSGFIDDLFLLLAKVGEIAIAVAACAVALVILRYLALRWRARSPRVQLSSVTQAMPDAGEDELDSPWVESLMREELSELRLSTAEAIPEATSGAPLMEIVEGIGEGIGDKSRLGSALGRLYRAILPEAAYEVSATLRPSLTGEGGTISVQVVDRTRRNPTQVNNAEDSSSWKGAARSAAAGIAGALYPQVADRHRGPWTHWREPVPGDLIILHDEALRHEKHNRLDQAMGAYHEALDRDPLNPTLRLKIAMLQERLELDLSAWATYRAIGDETHRDSWKGADRRVRLLALYRLAILLGNRRVASRWVGEPADETDKRRRDELREALATDRHLIRASWWSRMPGLATCFPIRFATTASIRLLDELGRPLGPRGGLPSTIADAKANRGQWLGGQLRWRHEDGETKDAAEKRIRDLLEILSLARLEQLDARLRRRPPWRPWRWADWWRYRTGPHRVLERREFSLSAVRVSKLIARIRIVSSAKNRLDTDELARLRAVKGRDRLLRRWPFWPTVWRRPARLLRPRHRLADRREDSWQFHYNAACAVSRVVADEIDPSADPRSRREANLVEAGLKQLEEYVHRAGSDQVRLQADWVGREDDDLNSLRATAEYVRWANHHLPEIPAEIEDAAESRIDPTRIAARIGYAGARAFATCWHERADGPNPKAELNAIWWREEEKAWEVLGTIFAEHQSWRQRWDGIVALQNCLRAGGGATPIRAAYRPADRRATGDLSCLLLGLRGASEEAGWDPEVDFTAIGNWARRRARQAHEASEETAAIGHPGLRSQLEQREALRANRIWSQLADALKDELDDIDDSIPGERLRLCLSRINAEISPGNGSALHRRPRRIVREAIDVMRGA